MSQYSQENIDHALISANDQSLRILVRKLWAEIQAHEGTSQVPSPTVAGESVTTVEIEDGEDA